jgi:hypothetical protein
MGEAAARWLDTADAPARPIESSATGPEDAGVFRGALAALGEQIDRGEELIERALGGARGMDAGQLIALQAGIYRYSEAVDLTAKLVDRASGAVRATLQNQG